jgi:glutamate formiminotransferase / formiminotetrahydrofolate cyclodeaminase
MKIIECVPNFSEGKNEEFFNALKEEAASVEGCKLLSLEPDADYNRVVVTLAGDERGIVEGALRCSKVAAKYIDMTTQKGGHPRQGAIDVVPFVPVKNVTMQECVKLAEEFGEAVAKELNVPVYLYEEAARKPERQNLSIIRKGEYEALEEKLKKEEWKPDFGEAKFNAKLGGIVTGARVFLVAFNVNIDNNDIKYSKEIGEILRESGRPKKDESGNVVKVNGQTVREEGRLKAVKGMGVALEKYNISQVSMNLTNYKVTPIHVAFEEAKKEADRLGVKVNGSEIVGLVPLEAILMAGEFYAQGEKLNEDQLVDLAIEKLGLNALHPFNKREKIIDYMI